MFIHLTIERNSNFIGLNAGNNKQLLYPMLNFIGHYAGDYATNA
jgi:hypothetical protein